MRLIWVSLTLIMALAALAPGGEGAASQPWRSTLYPEDWRPGFSDEQGRFLHDFSYAGYAMGERPLPGRGESTIVLEAREEGDDTERIQAALDEVGERGGGVVVLGAGVFRIAPPGEDTAAALQIKHPNVVLRGAGPDETVLINTEPVMRRRQVILVAPPQGTGGVWHRSRGGEFVLAEDAANLAERVRLDVGGAFAPGDWVVVTHSVTDEFIAEHDMTGLWQPRLGGVAFYRQIEDVEEDGTVLVLDIPLRYPMRVRDNARVYRVVPHLEDVGIEDLAIGMVEHPGEGFGANDYRTEGTAAWDVHSAHVITVSHTVNGWVRNVHTMRPPGNARDVHMTSNGILLSMSRNITVSDCVIQRPQYRGGGGNGYGITFQGSDCLVTSTRVAHCRHNYSFKSMWTTGNVVHKSRGEHGMLSSDFHMHLSPANLFDSVTVNRDWLEARYRPYGTIVHGHPTTQSVFWNTRGEAGHPRMGDVIVDSRQFGWGYIIGTQGPVHSVRTRPTLVPGSGSVPVDRETAPEDFVEGVGRGTMLRPESLYEDQLRRRMHAR